MPPLSVSVCCPVKADGSIWSQKSAWQSCWMSRLSGLIAILTGNARMLTCVRWLFFVLLNKPTFLIMWFGPHTALTLCYQRHSFCLSMFFSFFPLNYNLVLSPFISHTPSVGVFFPKDRFPSTTIFSLSFLIFFGWAAFSNTVRFKRSEISCFRLKSPWVFLVRRCHTLSPSRAHFLPNQNVVC